MLGVLLPLVLAEVVVLLVGMTHRRPVARAADRTAAALRGALHLDGPETRDRLLSAALVVAAGVVVTVAVCWPLGLVAGALERAVDVPAFTWAQQRQVGWWVHVNSVATLMGNRPYTKALVVVAGVGLAALRLAVRRRGGVTGGPWVPPLVLVVGYACERVLQQLLAQVVDRGHPPTTLGTWPSGGCARLVVVYGLVWLLLTRTWPVPTGLVRAGWTLVAALAVLECYTRIYLLKHWSTDAYGGLVFGLLVLAAMVVATSVLDDGSDASRPAGERRLASAGRQAPGEGGPQG